MALSLDLGDDDATDHDDVVEEGARKAQVEEVGKDTEKTRRAEIENLMAGPGCVGILDYFLSS